MSVDLTDLQDLLKAEVDPPGTNSFPDAVDDDWANQLISAFWETRLDGIVTNYEADDDGVVTPITGTTEFSRDLQQLVIFYAGIRVVRNKILNINAVFRAKAGPVEYETQQSATVLKAILDELVRKRNLILTRLSDVGITSSYYIDAVISRMDSLTYGSTTWINY